MLEQASKKSLPDPLISGCSGVLFGPVLAGKPTKPVLAGEQIKKSASSAGTRSRRTATSNQLRDSTSDFRCCQQREPPARHSRLLRPGCLCGTERSRPNFSSPSLLRRVGPAQRGISLLFAFLLGTQDRPGRPNLCEPTR